MRISLDSLSLPLAQTTIIYQHNAADDFVDWLYGGSATMFLIAIIALFGLMSIPKGVRILRVVLTWISALAATCYLSNLSHVSWGDHRGGPFDSDRVAIPYGITVLTCIVFAIFSTIRAKRDRTLATRMLAGPLPFVLVVGATFGAVYYSTTDQFYSALLAGTGHSQLAVIFWLATCLLVVFQVIAWVQERAAKTGEQPVGPASSEAAPGTSPNEPSA